VNCRIEVGYVADGAVNPPLGARGGGAAASTVQYRRLPGGALEPLDACAQIWIEDGESIVCVTGGGGGYGDPKDRDPARVRHDVAEGVVSRERAAAVYGVIVGDDAVPRFEAPSGLGPAR
jgi:N-methylhydantoinase B